MPRLTDFDPKWIDLPGRKGLGFTYRCTTGHCKGYNVVLFANPIDGGPAFEGDSWALIDAIAPEEHRPLYRGCGSCRWQRTGDTFDTLSLTPSINAYECGHFTVTNGGW